MIPEFKEKQKFGQWWLWLILLTCLGFLGYQLYQQKVLNEQVGNVPIDSNLLLVIFVLMLGLVILFGMMKLTTKINQREIKIHFAPFVKKTLQWKDIESAKVERYGFVGGWGIRIWTKYGTVYNTMGDIGLKILLKNGQKYVIGTQKPGV